MEITPIAHFHSPFTSKFGIPKQSSLVEELEGTIVFEPSFRDADYVRGLEEFDFIWLIWGFSANAHEATSPLVRPPLLGGNARVGVFASRSPYRPNPLALSSVRISRIEHDEQLGTIIHVLGADLMDGTPIYDIKPYIAFADAHPQARSGFVDTNKMRRLNVVFQDDVAEKLTSDQTDLLRKILQLDPRPHYQNDPNRVYGMMFDGKDLHFVVKDDKLTVVSFS